MIALKLIIGFYTFVISYLLFLFKSIINNLLTILIITLLLLQKMSFRDSITTSIFLISTIAVFIEWRFNLETFRSMYDYTYNGIILAPQYKHFAKNGETTRTSLKIKIKNEYFRVIRFSKIVIKNMKFDKREREIDKPEGFVVFDKNRNIINDKNKLQEILKIYNIWHYFYINPLFAEINVNYYLLKNGLYFNRLMIKAIKKRQSNNYSRILKKTDEEYVLILKELDNQVLKQSPYLQAKVKAQLELIISLYNIWEKPSDETYVKMEQLYKEIEENADNENVIWDIRLNYWHKLSDYYTNKIAKIKPDMTITNKSIILTFIEMYITKQILGLGLILDKLYELTKYPLKLLLFFYNKKIIYHKIGIDAIKKNIELNKRLKEISNKMTFLKDEPLLNLVRN
ncbi:MAG: hypothetical protein AABX25_00355 [Nanoarchaeota archaeon]